MRSSQRTASRIATLLAAGTVMAALLAATPVTASGDSVADPGGGQPLVIGGAEEFGPFTPTLSNVSLFDAAPAEAWRPGDPEIERSRQDHEVAPRGEPANPTTWTVDPLLELQEELNRDRRELATPDLNFAGQAYSGVNPPDTVGDVGGTYYVQAINAPSGTFISAWNKTTGAPYFGPADLSILGSGNCATGAGDPIVLYDHLADRWVLSEFSGAGNDLCVYVSQTTDPGGTYFAYDFPTPNFPDYPKYSVWPDAYYVTTNEFSGVPEPAVYALDRTQMLAGLPATSQRFTAPPLAGFGFNTLTPADLDGASPPAGAPGYFGRHRDDELHNPGANNPTSDFLDLFEFSVDWATPANSTFTGPVSVPVTEFDSELCDAGPGSPFDCFQQPSGGRLDAVREVLMWRLVYRNFGAHEKLVGNFVVDVDNTDHGGVRWFELRKSGAAAWSVFQEGTYAPDGHNRWMGSIAVDQNGNMVLGYNVTSPTQTPDLRYVGRLAGDPMGTMPDGEFTLVAAGGSNGSTRWGDYSSMNVDPVDGCTFWLTGETALASTFWATQIGKFSFDGCALDTTAPGVTVTTPANGASFAQGAVVLSSYSCVDEPVGSGLALRFSPLASRSATLASYAALSSSLNCTASG